MENIKLKIEDLSKEYTEGGNTVALDHVSFEVRTGEFLSILGPSGCGKTTLLRILIGLLDPSTGKILLDGEDITTAPRKRPPPHPRGQLKRKKRIPFPHFLCGNGFLCHTEAINKDRRAYLARHNKVPGGCRAQCVAVQHFRQIA